MPLSKLNFLEAMKIPLFILIATALNIVIFILIQQMVSKEHTSVLDLVDVNFVEFIHLDKKPAPPKTEQAQDDIEPPPPEPAPPPPEIVKPQIESAQVKQMYLPLPEINLPLSLSNKPYLGDALHRAVTTNPSNKPSQATIDMNVTPILRVPPIYPRRALRSGIEGVVTVEFTIAVDGSVKDAVVVEAEPPEIFESAVLTAITQWRYNPDIMNGKPVEKRARQDIKFKLQR